MSALEAFRSIKTNPTTSDRLQLAGVFALGFGGIGLYFWLGKDNPGTATVLGAIGFGGAVLALIPPLGRLLYIAWMALGIFIGLFTQPVILFVLYALLIVPVGLIFKAMGRDKMKRTIDKAASTYWEPYEETKDRARYFRQF